MAFDLEQLHHVDSKVQFILIKYPECRDSDRLLMSKYIELFAPQFINTPAPEALKDPDYPSQETVGRCRRKLQATFEELQGTKRVKAIKEELEDVYKTYAAE